MPMKMNMHDGKMSGMSGMSHAHHAAKRHVAKNQVDTAKAKAAAGATLTLEGKPSVGEETTLSIQVKDAQGEPVTSFDKVHTKPMHLILVSSDLEDFQHLHPTLKNGTFTVKTAFERARPYDLVAEYEPKGGDEAQSRMTAKPQGARSSAAKLGPEVDAARAAHFTWKVGGATVKVGGADGLKHGKKTKLTLEVTDAQGKPAKLQSWLGMPAHAIVFSEDRQSFLHLHGMPKGMSMSGMHDDGMDMGGMDMGGMDMGGMQMGGTHKGHSSASASGDKDLEIDVTFPKSGRYKIWVQFQLKGEVQTVPFAVNVA